MNDVRVSEALVSNSLPGDSLPGDDANPNATVARGSGESSDRWPLWLWLGAPIAVLLAAALLRVGPERQVLLPWIDIAIPETCAMYARTGLDCPGCGLTRSFIHIAHGRAWGAWQLNPISWPLFALVAVQIPIAGLHFKRQRPVWLAWLNVANQSLMLGIMGIMVLRWIVLLMWGAWLA